MAVMSVMGIDLKDAGNMILFTVGLINLDTSRIKIFQQSDRTVCSVVFCLLFLTDRFLPTFVPPC
jgi:hypothetical protein